MKNRFVLLLMIMMCSLVELHSQSKVDSLPVNGQFIDLIENSNSYQQYKVIELNRVQALKNNVNDTLALLYKEISVNETELAEQKSEIQSLESKMEELNAELNLTIEEKNSVNFLGMQVEKSSFKAIMWSIVIFLVLALLFFIYKFYNSQKVTVESKKELIEAHKELEEQRRRHIKKEQNIMRQLQDEINKNNR